MAYPVRPVTYPTALRGKQNGRLPSTILHDIAGHKGAPDLRLVAPAHRAWTALSAAASRAGFPLTATSLYDSYRPYVVQETIFRKRYRRVPRYASQPATVWNGVKWYLWDGATAAVPGTSNHGWGLAVDTALWVPTTGGGFMISLANSTKVAKDALAWLLANELDYGFSHEIQSEAWHIRYFTGDHIPQAVLDYENGDDMPLSAADLAEVEKVVRKVLNEGTGNGQPNWAATSKAQLAQEQETANDVDAIKKHLGA